MAGHSGSKNGVASLAYVTGMTRVEGPRSFPDPQFQTATAKIRLSIRSRMFPTSGTKRPNSIYRVRLGERPPSKAERTRRERGLTSRVGSPSPGSHLRCFADLSPPGRGENENPFSRRAFFLRPSFDRHEATKQFGGAVEAVSLTKQLFSELAPGNKGKAERRKAHCPINVRDKRGVRTVFPARPPFGAHACGTRHRLLPRWLSSGTGFPAAAANESFARFAKSAAVKHAPCGPVFLPVDRGPEAAREREGRTPARGHRISLSSIRRHRLTSLNNERGGGVYGKRRKRLPSTHGYPSARIRSLRFTFSDVRSK